MSVDLSDRERFVFPGCTTRGTNASWATMSDCGRYRYALGRRWSDTNLFTLSLVMLNPSTANHDANDPTIRKCIHFAKLEGCGAILVRNLFAWRAKNATELRHVEDPYGPQNHAALAVSVPFSKNVAAWGALTPQWLHQLATVVSCRVTTEPQRALYVFGVTKDGHPRHPLYLRNDAKAVRW